MGVTVGIAPGNIGSAYSQETFALPHAFLVRRATTTYEHGWMVASA